MERSTLFQLIIMLNCCPAVEHYLFSDAPDTGNINLFTFITVAELVEAPNYNHPFDSSEAVAYFVSLYRGELCLKMALESAFCRGARSLFRQEIPLVKKKIPLERK